MSYVFSIYKETSSGNFLFSSGVMSFLKAARSFSSSHMNSNIISRALAENRTGATTAGLRFRFDML